MEEEEVVIKVEDQLGIFVKEEEAFIGALCTAHYDENASINLDNFLNYESCLVPLKRNVQKELIIYTTRLEDMFAWKETFINNPKSILDRAINESKPIWSGKYNKKRRRKYKVRFEHFKQNLQRYNYMAACSNGCESVKINTKGRRNQQKGDGNKKNGRKWTKWMKNHNTDSFVTDNEIDVIPIPNAALHNVSWKELGIEDIFHLASQKLAVPPIASYFIIQTLNFASDIYLVSDDGVVREYYQLESDLKCLDSTAIDKTVRLNSCCWFQREDKVKNNMLKDYNTACKAFLRIPHGCDPGKCVCCCKNKYFGNKYVEYKSLEQPIRNRNYLKNRWHQRLLHDPAQDNPYSIINAAIAHKPKRKNLYNKSFIYTSQSSLEKDYYRDVCLRLQLAQSFRTNNYYIGNTGFITNMVCTDHPETFNNLIEAFKPVIGLPYSERICCLTKYKQYLSVLTKQAQCTVVKFLMNRSIQLEKKCSFCTTRRQDSCTTTRGQAFPLILPRYPRHTKNYRNKKLHNVMGNRRFVEKCNEVENIQTDKSLNIVLPLKNTKHHEIEETHKNVNECNDTTDLDIEDLRLVIFPSGNVKIQTKRIPQKLSTENLKLLREILVLARDKIVPLGLKLSNQISITNLFNYKLFSDKIPKTSSELINIEQSSTIKTLKNHSDKMETSFSNQSTLINRKNIRSTAYSANTHVIGTQTSHNQTNKNNLFNKKSTNIKKKINVKELIAKNTNPNRRSLVNTINDTNVYAPETVGALEQRKNNFYLSFSQLSALKRKQYLIANEYIKVATNDLWKNVNVYEYQVGMGEEVVRCLSSKHLDSFKRKTCDSSTSPPPKQRKPNLDEITSKNPILANALNLHNAILPAFMQSGVEAIDNTSVMVLPNDVPSEDVAVVPTGQLPQEMLTNIYPCSPDQDDLKSEQIDITEHPVNDPLMFSTDNIITNVVPTALIAPPDTYVNAADNTDVEHDDDDDKDCILGV